MMFKVFLMLAIIGFSISLGLDIGKDLPASFKAIDLVGIFIANSIFWLTLIDDKKNPRS